MQMTTWSTALAYALGGDETPELGGVPALVPALGPVVAAVGGTEALVAAATAEQEAGRPWPRPVDRPADVGPAQWAALLGAAERLVGRARAERSGRVLGGRVPDADERRLLRDVPPHHGG
jgi:hypothetical protein